MEKENYQTEDFLLNESFQRYILQPTAEDAEYWESWMADHPDATVYIEDAKEIIRFVAARRALPKNEHYRRQVYKRLQYQIHAEKQRNLKQIRSIPMKFYWYAASVLLLAGLAITMKYMTMQKSFSTAGQFLQVIVPDGQRSQVILPDGTKVWLNSGSVLKYPVDFLVRGREVHLSGEAFFDVKHRNNQPFIVSMKDNLFIRVLGTEFNLKCYPSDNEIEATLLEGSIRLIQEDGHNHIIREIHLEPKEKAVYQKRSQDFAITPLESASREENAVISQKPEKEDYSVDEIELVTAWKNEELVFHDESFEEIAERMERWFGMKITVNDENLKQERFTGKFVNNETIYQILDILNRSEPIQYNIRNKEIIINKRKRIPKP
jgi:transmembrane sensor